MAQLGGELFKPKDRWVEALLPAKSDGTPAIDVGRGEVKFQAV